MIDKLLSSITQLSNSTTNSKIINELNSVAAMIKDEGDIVRHLYEKYLEKPIVMPTRPADPPVNKQTKEFKETKSEIGKWGALDNISKNRSAVSVHESSVHSGTTKPTV